MATSESALLSPIGRATDSGLTWPTLDPAAAQTT